MKRVGWFALVVLVCAPMVLSLVLLLMVQWPRMDGITQKMPVDIKATVARAIVRFNGRSEAARTRARKLDVNAAKQQEDFYAYSDLRLSETATGDSSRNDLDEQAGKLEKAHDFCKAEDLYTKASSASASTNEYWHTEGMGRTALFCGDMPGARAGLEASLEKADAYLKAITDDPDDVEDTKKDIREMQEMLVIVYDREHEKKLSVQSCQAAHPEWKKCGCSVKDDKVSCVEGK